MKLIAEFKKYMGELSLIALPMLMGNTGQILINIGDVFVSGHYSTNCLAAISVATAIFMSLIIPGLGLLSAVTPVLSNYRGEKKPTKQYFGLSIAFSQVLAIVFFFVLFLIIPLIYKSGLNPKIIEDVVIYLKISAFSVFGVFLFASIKEYLQAHEVVLLPNILMIIAVFLNVGLNYILVFGVGKIPELGTAGLAIASLTVRTLLGLSLLVYCHKIILKSNYGDFSYIGDLIKIGMPAAGAVFIEFLGFNIIAFLTGRLEPYYAACHNIIITVTSLVYMIPFSLSCALSVKTGYANGKKCLSDIKKFTLHSVLFMFLYAGFVAILFILGAPFIMKIFTSDPLVIKTGVSIMLIVAAFEFFDGLQGVFTGTLKGMKRTKSILFVMVSSYILISIPLGLLFANKYGLALKGYWLGLAFALFAASVISGGLYVYYYFKLKKIFIADKVM